MNNRFIEAIARRIAETTPEFQWLKDFFQKTIKRNASVITTGNTNTSQGNLAEWDANGDLADSGHSTNQDLNKSDDVDFNTVHGTTQVKSGEIRVKRNLVFDQGSAASLRSNGQTGLTGMYNALLEVDSPQNNEIGLISSSNFYNSSIIFLKFDSDVLVKHKVGAPADIRLHNKENYTFKQGDMLVLQYHNYDTFNEWREIGRLADKPVDGGFVGTTDTQTLTNKTFDANNNTATNFKHGNEVDNPSSNVHGVTGNVVGTSDTQTLTNKTINGNNNSLSNIAQSTIYAEQESITKLGAGQFTLNPTKRVVDLGLDTSTISGIDTSAFQPGEIFIINNGIMSSANILLGVGIYMLDEDYYMQFNGNEYPLKDNDIHLFLVIGSGTIKEIARYKAANSQLDNTRINTVSSNYQTKAEDLLKVSSSGTTITVSDYDINQGNAIKIKDTSGSAGSSAITINTQSGQNIDGGSSISINTNYGSAIVQSDGSNVFSF